MQRHSIGAFRKPLDGTSFDSPWGRFGIGRLLLLSVLFLGVCAAFALAEGSNEKDLQLFYQQNCVHCHGTDGSAIGQDGEKLKGQDLTDERWLQGTSDDKMVKAILNGKFFGVAMPKFKDTLSKDEAQRMVTDIIRQSRRGKIIGPENKD